MKYRFYCKRCGESFSSDDREQKNYVERLHRASHNAGYAYTPIANKQTKVVEYTRPGLAEILKRNGTHAGIAE